MRTILTSLIGLLIIIGFASPSSKETMTSDVPPPGTRAERYTAYNWNIDDRAFPPSATDRLNWGADQVAQTGSKTIRVFFGARDIYHLSPDGPQTATELAQLAAIPAYDRLFRDARFSTFILTTYTYASREHGWVDGFSAAEYALERAEIKRLGEYLLKNPLLAGKTFIILNWEGDNEMNDFRNKDSIWKSYRDSVEARADGVRDARAASAASTARIFSGLEFNRVRSAKTGAPCGTPPEGGVGQDRLINRCVLDYVAPRVSVDYYSYSAWQTTAESNQVPSIGAKLKADMRFAVDLVKATRPEMTEANFMIGEFGFERARFGECRAADLLRDVLSITEGADALGVSYLVFWQIIDNESLYGALDERFGLFRTAGSALVTTRPGLVFKAAIAGTAEPALPKCSTVVLPPKAWGVVNEATGQPDFHLNPDPTLAIMSDVPFSNSGNTVRFAQSALDVALTSANATSFTESPSRMTVGLPPSRRPGLAWVFVTNAEGIDTNIQSITLQCANCPLIDEECGVLTRDGGTRSLKPGAPITIRGSFPAPGNTVLIEQQTVGGVAQWTTVTKDANWTESADKITATLPTSLLVNQDAGVYVVDSAGRYSNQQAVFIPLVCSDCSPEISFCQPFGNQVASQLHPGAKMTVRGSFPSSGNRLIIDQWDEQGSVVRREVATGSPGWNESANAIDFRLPTQLLTGRAVVYVVDSQGRETTAAVIETEPTTLAVVSAASFRAGTATPGGVMAAFGNALAVTTEEAATRPLPTTLSGTRLVITDQAGTAHDAPLFFVSPNQLNFQVPETVALGTATIRVESGDGSLSTFTIEIVSVAPGIFSANSDGAGAAAAFGLHAILEERIYESTALFDGQSGYYVTAPIQFGPPPEDLYLVLFGTGFRLRTDLAAVKVMVGDAVGEVTYAGPQEVFYGLDQINVKLPRSLEHAGEVSVQVTVEGKAANPVRVRFQ